MALTTQHKKIILIGAGVLVAGYVGYRLIKNNGTISIGYDPTGNGSAATTNTANFNPSAIATSLYDAMKEMGTKEKEVFNALSGLSPAQFVQVYNKFGSRVYNTITGSIYIPIWSNAENWKENLKTWLKEELSDSDYAVLKKKFASTNLL
nr:hypothetical protein [uncultured Flavobacterium sp.]